MLAGWFRNVRLTCTSKRRVPKNGILSLSTCASSITSPVLIRPAAFMTAAAFWWLPEPRSSPAPHLDGQRSFSAGGNQVGWDLREHAGAHGYGACKAKGDG